MKQLRIRPGLPLGSFTAGTAQQRARSATEWLAFSVFQYTVEFP